MGRKSASAIVGVYLFVFLVSLYSLTISTSLSSRNSGEGFMRLSEMEYFLQSGGIGWSGEKKWGSPGRDGKKYNWHQFGQQMMALPLYLFMRDGAYAYFIINIIATALTAVLLMRTLILLGFRVRPSALTALAFGTATLAFFYASKTSHEHAIAVAAIMGGVHYAVRYQMGMGRRNLYWCVLAIGLGFTVRHDVILSLLPIGTYLYLGRGEHEEQKLPLRKAVLISAALMVPFFVANFTCNYVRFGNILETGYAASTGAPDKLFGFEFLIRGLLGSLISPGRSIFLFSPVLFLFPFYVRQFRRKVDRRFFILWVEMSVMYLLFYSYHHSWDGEWCFGPRYFLVIVPFLMMPLVLMFEGFKGKGLIKKSIIVVVLVFSLISQVVFVSSNTWISNTIKYGIDDDSRPDLKFTSRSFGTHGSWEWLWSFFPLKYSQFLNQFRVFRYTALIAMDKSNIYKVTGEIINSDYSYLRYYIHMFLEFDVWWMQDESIVRSEVAILPGVACFISLLLMLRASGKADREAEGTRDPAGDASGQGPQS